MLANYAVKVMVVGTSHQVDVRPVKAEARGVRSVNANSVRGEDARDEVSYLLNKNLLNFAHL